MIINKSMILHIKMKYKTILFLVLLVGILVLAGCAKDQYTGNVAYNPQQQGQQQPYIGGGCGVAPADNLGGSPASIGPATSNL